MLYVIDGYNVTRSDPATCRLSLEEQREALVARVRARGREMLGTGRVVVVFDAQEGDHGASVQSAPPVEVRYSRARSADDEIVALVADAAGRQAVTVVTSDSGLAARVRTHGGAGVRIVGREVVFDAAGRADARKGPRRYPASGAGVPAGGNEITAELKKLWLTEDQEG